jgi:hypothetical protein
MTDTPKPEGGQEQVSQELPTPKFTGASADSATSSVDTTALAKEVAKLIMPEFQKMAQSTKDKRIADIEKQMSRLGLSDLAELEGMGAQIPDNVKQEFRFRQLESQRQTPEAPSQTSTSQGSGANLTAQDVSEAVRQYQLDANTPEVLEVLRGTYRNRDHFEATLARVALARSNKPTPTPAESASLQSQPPAGKMAADVADQKYGELGRLLKEPSRNASKIESLKKELIDAGYDV